MFGVYAAEVQFHHESAERDRAQRVRMLRAARMVHEGLPAAVPARRAAMASRSVAWPRPIVLHAA